MLKHIFSNRYVLVMMESLLKQHADGLMTVMTLNLGLSGPGSTVSPQTVNKDGRRDRSSKVKPKSLNRPLVAGCSIGHQPRLRDILKSPSSRQIICLLYGFCYLLYFLSHCLFKCSFS